MNIVLYRYDCDYATTILFRHLTLNQPFYRIIIVDINMTLTLILIATFVHTIVQYIAIVIVSKTAAENTQVA